MYDMPFQTKRQEVLEAYDAHGRSYEVNTKPYHSTETLVGEVVNRNETDQYAYCVFRPQTLEFFGYGVGERHIFGAAERAATDADTNLAKAKSTNGASDFVIEGLGFSVRGKLARDNSAGFAHGNRFDDANATDPAVVDAINGLLPMVDPSAVFMPPQVHSPVNLENAMFQGVLPFLSVELEWDRRRTEKLGAADIMPQGGAHSYLRASGQPRRDNQYRIPEGYIWRREGQPDSELIVRVRLQTAVIIPITLNDDPDDAADTVGPDRIFLELVCRINGLEVELPSGN